MIYLDNAATTKTHNEILPIIEKYLSDFYYNPSALYSEAVEVAKNIKTARKNIADILKIDSSTLIFTSSGTESDNQALFGTRKRPGARIIISAIEHAAVKNAASELKQQGYDVRECPVKPDGTVDETAFNNLLTENTALVSIMHVSNETGAVNDIERLAAITKAYNKNILFHSDGVQAFCKIPVNLNTLGVDYYSISGHKIGAPKGIAALYVKKGAHIKPLIFGGGQENGLRSSTENVAGIAAFGAASIISSSKLCELKSLADRIFGDVLNGLKSIEGLKVISEERSAPHILTLALPYVRGEVMMHSLEKHGVIIGIGSACSSKKGTGTVQKALGLSEKYRDGMIRLSVGLSNNIEDGIKAAKAISAEYQALKSYTRG